MAKEVQVIEIKSATVVNFKFKDEEVSELINNIIKIQKASAKIEVSPATEVQKQVTKVKNVYRIVQEQEDGTVLDISDWVEVDGKSEHAVSVELFAYFESLED